MLETTAEKKIPPPLPPKTRRGCLKNGDVDGSGGATILQSNGHVVKIRIDPMMSNGGGNERENEQPRREHAVGRRSSTVKINITCVDPFVFRRSYDEDDEDDDDEDDRRSSSGHHSPLDSGTGSDLDTSSRRDESDDGTCSCDSLTSSTADPETTPVRPLVAAFSPPVSTIPVTDSKTMAVVAAAIATVVEELPKRPLSPVTAVTKELPKLLSPPRAVHVKQRCYGDDVDTTIATAVAGRVIDMNNTDQYYSFHMNENVFDEVDATTNKLTNDACKNAVTSDTICSAKGTIRGVKNRVRASIATFLQPKTNKVIRMLIFSIIIIII